LISFVCRMNQEPIRSPARSISNLEFHNAGDRVNEVARKIVQFLQEAGVPALNPAMGFPMEMDRFPGRIWVVSHKPVAVAAGLGRMGIHRNVIHPRLGNFILLGTVLVGAALDSEDQPIEYNPCLECKLCVAACPVGAIGTDGGFDFSACYTHNYREFMGGFTDWVEKIADASNAIAYRRAVTDAESASMWQSLSFGANYKSAYCMAVCPAGEEVIGRYLDDRRQHLEQVVRPLQVKAEAVYVVRGSDAEEHVQRRFPSKSIRQVANSLRPRSIGAFLEGLPLLFQPGRARDVNAAYHFRFTGEDEIEATVTIRGAELRVEAGAVGRPDLRVVADSRTWLEFLAKERGLLGALVRGKIRLRGSPLHLRRFARCFAA
jgi:Fe-S-cluster-containing hydrogenase component 2